MYNKVCKICGKEFQAVNKNYCLCSPECRKISERESHKDALRKYYATTLGKERSKRYYKEHRTLVNKQCACCGTKLDDGRQSYCLNCLLKDYRDNPSVISRKRLYSRGFDKAMIEEEIKERTVTQNE